MTGQGDYILRTNIHNFFNEVIREARMNTYHRMVQAVLQGEGSQRNGAYQRRRICCPIKLRMVQPFTEVEAEFATLKGGVDRAQRPTKA